MTTYLYPQNLKATVKMWLWSLRDFAIIFISLLFSVVALVNGILFPAVFTVCYGIVTIRPDDMAIIDYLRNAVMYFFTVQQMFYWRAR